MRSARDGSMTRLSEAGPNGRQWRRTGRGGGRRRHTRAYGDRGDQLRDAGEGAVNSVFLRFLEGLVMQHRQPAYHVH
jgi:hypothetical protein